MPSYSEVQKDELTRIKAEVMVCWTKDDQFHNFNKWKPNLKKIPRATAYIASRCDEAAWSYKSRERAIVKFLTGVDYMPAAQQVVTAPTQTVASTEGVKATARQAVVFRGEEANANASGGGGGGGNGDATTAVLGSAAQCGLEQETRQAVQELIDAYHSGTLDAMMRASAGNRTDAARFFSYLPVLSPSSLAKTSAAEWLRDLGVWSARAAMASQLLAATIGAAPRYFNGRRVCTPLGLGTLLSFDDGQRSSRQSTPETPEGDLSDEHQPEPAGTCRQRSPRPNQRFSIVDIDGGLGVSRVSQRELLDLNQGHVLPIVKKGGGLGSAGIKGSLRSESEVMYLEDGIKLDYASPLARAKMVQCALALGPFLETLVKDEPDGTCSLDVAALDAARISAIVALRCVLDITTFQRAPKGTAIR